MRGGLEEEVDLIVVLRERGGRNPLGPNLIQARRHNGGDVSTEVGQGEEEGGAVLNVLGEGLSGQARRLKNLGRLLTAVIRMNSDFK